MSSPHDFDDDEEFRDIEQEEIELLLDLGFTFDDPCIQAYYQ